MNENRHDPTVRHAAHGFTIIEIMIAVAIGAMILAGAFYFANQFFEGAKKSTTKTTLTNTQLAISTYNANTGEYPNALTDLIKQPQGVKNWHQFLDREPKDAWGYKLLYRRTPDGEHPYELYSYGGDKGKKEPKSKRLSLWQ